MEGNKQYHLDMRNKQAPINKWGNPYNFQEVRNCKGLLSSKGTMFLLYCKVKVSSELISFLPIQLNCSGQ
jgi:hypothetical protein